VQNGERQETDCYIYQEFQLGFVGIFNSWTNLYSRKILVRMLTHKSNLQLHCWTCTKYMKWPNKVPTILVNPYWNLLRRASVMIYICFSTAARWILKLKCIPVKDLTMVEPNNICVTIWAQLKLPDSQNIHISQQFTANKTIR
jgi:hypothetical protein